MAHRGSNVDEVRLSDVHWVAECNSDPWRMSTTPHSRCSDSLSTSGSLPVDSANFELKESDFGRRTSADDRSRLEACSSQTSTSPCESVSLPRHLPNSSLRFVALVLHQVQLEGKHCAAPFESQTPLELCLSPHRTRPCFLTHCLFCKILSCLSPHSHCAASTCQAGFVVSRLT